MLPRRVPIFIADLGKHHLERMNLITANRSHMTAINVRAREQGSKDPNFAMTRSFSGVHRSGMIPTTELTV